MSEIQETIRLLQNSIDSSDPITIFYLVPGAIMEKIEDATVLSADGESAILRVASGEARRLEIEYIRDLNSREIRSRRLRRLSYLFDLLQLKIGR